MTENSVSISITIKVEEQETIIEKEIGMIDLEEAAQALGMEIGQRVMQASIQAMDERIGEEIPQGWRNVGTDERWLASSVGEFR